MAARRGQIRKPPLELIGNQYDVLYKYKLVTTDKCASPSYPLRCWRPSVNVGWRRSLLNTPVSSLPPSLSSSPSSSARPRHCPGLISSKSGGLFLNPSPLIRLDPSPPPPSACPLSHQ